LPLQTAAARFRSCDRSTPHILLPCKAACGGPASRIVLAKMSSRPAPTDDAMTAAEARFLGQVARGLQEGSPAAAVTASVL
jgi:hypothetical protein